MGAVGRTERVYGIGSERMDQSGDLGGVDFSVAGADRMDAVDWLSVSE
jgi:hypothetical protein